MKNLNKIFKWLMWLLFAISVGIIAWGLIAGYPSSPAQDDGGTVNVLLYWCYIMIGLGVFCAVVFGIAVTVSNNPKSLVKILIEVVAAAVICGIAYILAPASPAVGMLEQPTEGVLKFTDTILYIVGFAGTLAIIAIIFGEIWGAVRNK